MTLLRSGDRVTTPDGPGRVLFVEQREDFILGQKPKRQTMVMVELSDASKRRYFRADVVEPKGGPKS